MLLSILVFSFNSASGVATSYNMTIEDTMIQNFNNDFLKNAEGDVEIQDIITMVNLAKDYNTKNDLKYGDSRYISIVLNNIELTIKTDKDIINNILTNNQYIFFDGNPKKEYQKYKCNVKYDKDGKIKAVICKKILQI